MRLLAVTDIHGNSKMSKKLAETLQNEDFDALLIAGDLTHFTGAETAEKVLEPLMNLGKPIIAVHGNCDGRDVPELLEELGISAHNKRVELDEIGIVGIGGSNITPFNTVWELSEEEIRGILEQNYHDGDVVLSHAPPYNTIVDRVHSGLHVGSRALREFIKEKQPPLVVCGHIHEGRGIDRIGETPIVNPGPLFRGYYAVIDFKPEKEVKIELRKL
ncbi:YfcE family phosphodiesterase [Thermococcus sp. GR7]|uniref:metallophosphoesterase n=1 Tax=unclassified Thermococcus TaxID=2627626 RepID=UPI001430107E|nr:MULTISPECIES: metallophosphoesterase [unclassified Thermococcus]NJE46547.1 YfcE family phosphodiesterase [Thermococcus sp. GR7]NJE77533.1 YfcE family phosphodiesterase [Thermococcus sp. GR4]NJF23622.1 YfcE family phosphodiesterase [Thermococcus sp. GR5]